MGKTLNSNLKSTQETLHSEFFGAVPHSLQVRIYRAFRLIDGKMYRHNPSANQWKLVSRRERGLLVADFEKITYYATDIAWLLLYGIWPKYAVMGVDDSGRLDAENLVACSPKKARFSPYDFADRQFGKQGFGARGLSQTFKSLEECKEAWETQTLAKYLTAMPAVLAEQASVLALMEAKEASLPDVIEKEIVEAALLDPNLIPERPRAIPGRIWYFYVNEWLCLPLPCHELDEVRSRAKLYKQGFEYFYHHQGAIYALREAPTFVGSIPQ